MFVLNVVNDVRGCLRSVEDRVGWRLNGRVEMPLIDDDRLNHLARRLLLAGVMAVILASLADCTTVAHLARRPTTTTSSSTTSSPTTTPRPSSTTTARTLPSTVPTTAPTTLAVHTVVYRVSAICTPACWADAIDYTSSDGEVLQEMDIQLPVQYSATRDSGASYRVSASLGLAGTPHVSPTVTCTVTIDGTQVITQTAQGAGPVTCAGTVP